MDSPKIPATVSVLTRNSAATLSRALLSVKDFAEILVADGASADATLEIAGARGARVIPQNKLFQDADGRLNDWAGVRNECLELSTYPWHFYLDSDEYLTPELVEQVREIVRKNQPAVYWIPRKYVYHGTIIERSLSYPNQQLRFFHRGVVSGFRKPVHERIEPLPDAKITWLTAPILVPVEADVSDARKKMDRYIEMELRRQAPITRGAVNRMRLNAIKMVLRYLMRSPGFLFSFGPRIPLVREWFPVIYEFKLARAASKHSV